MYINTWVIHCRLFCHKDYLLEKLRGWFVDLTEFAHFVEEHFHIRNQWSGTTKAIYQVFDDLNVINVGSASIGKTIIKCILPVVTLKSFIILNIKQLNELNKFRCTIYNHQCLNFFLDLINLQFFYSQNGIWY